MTHKSTPAEIQSKLDRQRQAENLIKQLPKDHDGRNTWLLNYGQSDEAIQSRFDHPLKPTWSDEHKAAVQVSLFHA